MNKFFKIIFKCRWVKQNSVMYFWNLYFDEREGNMKAWLLKRKSVEWHFPLLCKHNRTRNSTYVLSLASSFCRFSLKIKLKSSFLCFSFLENVKALQKSFEFHLQKKKKKHTYNFMLLRLKQTMRYQISENLNRKNSVKPALCHFFFSKNHCFYAKQVNRHSILCYKNKHNL